MVDIIIAENVVLITLVLVGQILSQQQSAMKITHRSYQGESSFHCDVWGSQQQEPKIEECQEQNQDE